MYIVRCTIYSQEQENALWLKQPTLYQNLVASFGEKDGEDPGWMDGWMDQRKIVAAADKRDML